MYNRLCLKPGKGAHMVVGHISCPEGYQHLHGHFLSRGSTTLSRT